MLARVVLVMILVSLPICAPSPGKLAQAAEKILWQPADLAEHRDRLFKREYAAQDLDEIQRKFSDSVEKAVKYLNVDSSQMEILVHTRLKNQDMILLFANNTIGKNYSIQADVYATFMALSHLPVTVMATLLPDLVDNGYELPDNFSAHESLKDFQDSLNRLDTRKITSLFNITRDQSDTARYIIDSVSSFVGSTLLKPNKVNKEAIRRFASDIKPWLTKAAKFAVEDYFKALNCLVGLNCTSCVRINNQSGWGIVVAVDGLSYPGSFLEQYYTQLIETQFGSKETYSPRRLAFMPQPPCSTGTNADSATLTMALSNAALSSSISKIFDLSGPFPLHSLLSEAANELIIPPEPELNFEGFTSFEEKLYVILIVALSAIATVFMVVVISVCCEDKVMRMADKQTKLNIEARKKGPSLLTPMQEKKFTSSYTSFQQLKKRHTQDPQSRGNSKTEKLLTDMEATKYTRLSDPSSPVLNSGTSVYGGDMPPSPVLNSGTSVYGGDMPTSNAVTYSEIILAES